MAKTRRIPEAVSVRMAADILGVHMSTIRRWIRRGWMKGYRVGPYLVRIPRSEIKRMRDLRVAHSESIHAYMTPPQV